MLPKIFHFRSRKSERNKEDFKSKCLDLLQTPILLPLFISTSLMFFQQWSGVNAIIFYTVTIFKAAGSEAIDENLATIVVGIVQFFATFGGCAFSSFGFKLL